MLAAAVYFIHSGNSMATLPQSVYDAVAAADPVIVIPRGRWELTTPILPKAGTRIISGYGATLIPKNTFGIYAASSIVVPETNRQEWHLKGQINQGTSVLTLQEVCDLQVGETIVIRAGIRVSDPNEPYREEWKTVTAINGSDITLFPSFAEDYPNYGSIDVVRERAPGQEYKVSEWGEFLGHGIGRGYGIDHGFYKFQTQPIENLTIEGITLSWETDYLPNGAASFGFHLCRGISLQNNIIYNPRGVCIHCSGTDIVLVDGLTVRGKGRDFIWNTIETISVLFNGWGGRNLKYRNIYVNAEGMKFFSYERGTNDIVIQNFDFVSKKIGDYDVGLFGIVGEGDPVLLKNGRIDYTGADYYNAWGAPKTILDNVEFTRPLERTLAANSTEFHNGSKIGGKLFGPRRSGFIEIKNWTYGAINLPAGIYFGGIVTVSDSTKFDAITAPDEGLIFTDNKAQLSNSRWGDLWPGFPEEFGPHYYRQVYGWGNAANPIDIRIDFEYMPQEN